jgi:hypothetical protein
MDQYPKRIEGLDIEEAKEGYMIFETERDRVHYLNPSAALILELCTGANTVAGIADLVQEAYGLAEPPAEVVRVALKQMKEEGLLA